jgi:mannan endo-1,4-beta-mannosidase
LNRARLLGPWVIGLASVAVVACGGSAEASADSASPPAGPSAAAPVAGAERAAYWVDGSALRDPCGAEVVLRGVNKMAVFADRPGRSFAEIAKTGANAVRFMWLTEVPAREAVQTLQAAVDAQLVPIWELHDATGDWSKLPRIEAFWTAADTLEVLRQFESRVIVNIANEAGTEVADDAFVAGYARIVRRLREAGLRMPLMIDAAGYGRDVEQLLRLAPQLQAADPLGNLLFSWHIYDAGADQPARIDRAFDIARSGNLPLVVGEFGSQSPGACHLAVPWQHVIGSAQRKGIGWLAWSWDNMNGDCPISGGGSVFDMVGDGITLASLKLGWARQVALDDPASIRNTARRTAWQTSGRCAAP